MVRRVCASLIAMFSIAFRFQASIAATASLGWGGRLEVVDQKFAEIHWIRTVRYLESICIEVRFERMAHIRPEIQLHVI